MFLFNISLYDVPLPLQLLYPMLISSISPVSPNQQGVYANPNHTLKNPPKTQSIVQKSCYCCVVLPSASARSCHFCTSACWLCWLGMLKLMMVVQLLGFQRIVKIQHIFFELISSADIRNLFFYILFL